jgi:hypothetical protein
MVSKLPTTSAPRVRTPRRRCVVCGTPVRRRAERTCGPKCEKQPRVAAGHASMAKLQATKQRLRAEGRGPGSDTRGAGEPRRQHDQAEGEQRVWDIEHPDRPDPESYRSEILPKVEQMSLKAIFRATGLPAGYCTKIKRGEVVPHPRWWDALRERDAVTI